MKIGLKSYARAAIVAIGFALLMTACSTTKETADLKLAPGFLPKPDLLKRGGPGEYAYIYNNTAVSQAGYNKVILEPVMIWTAPNSTLDRVPAEKRQALANDFYGNLYEKLSTHCQMVNIPTPGAIKIRVALVDAEQSDPLANTISTYVPQAHVLNSLTAFAFDDGIGAFAGTATAESYATDATGGPGTGTLLWEAADRRGGANQIGTNTLNSWSDVQEAFQAWSEQAAQGLVKRGICYP